MCLVAASLTAITGNFNTPSFSIARSRITPVVVSSMLPMTLVEDAPGRRRASFAPTPRLADERRSAVPGDENHRRDEVGPVVHRDVRLMFQGRDEVTVIGVGCLRRGWRKTEMPKS